MNIMEAISSGKPFKRKGWPNDAWYEVRGGEYIVPINTPDEYVTDLLSQLNPGPTDIMATDWEVAALDKDDDK